MPPPVHSLLRGGRDASVSAWGGGLRVPSLRAWPVHGPSAPRPDRGAASTCNLVCSVFCPMGWSRVHPSRRSDHNFGSAFRTHQTGSAFSGRLAECCDVYTSSVENLLNVHHDEAMRPARVFLPHEEAIRRRQSTNDFHGGM